MPIIKSELKDYKSSAASSDGGAISAVQLPATELSANAAAAATVISVHDAGGFAASDEIILDDGTNKEKKTIQSIAVNDITVTIGLIYAYNAGTPVSKKNALLPDVTAQQANDGATIYRKFFRKNTNASLTWAAVVAWLSKQFTNAAISIGIGLDHADDTAGAQGNMSDFAATAAVALISDGADTRTVSLMGKDASGNLITENVVLTGAVEVLSVNTFSKLYRAYVSALDAARTVTIKQGAAGAIRGTIGINKKISFLWLGKMASAGTIVNAEGGDIPTQATGIKVGDIAVAGNAPIWLRMMVPVGAGAIANNTAFVQLQGETT